MKTRLLTVFAVILFSMGVANSALAREQISIVGSSTVFPFATTVAEKFGQQSDFKTPVIESTGSGGGLKMFCKGIGTRHPDIANASRAIKQREIDQCAELVMRVRGWWNHAEPVLVMTRTGFGHDQKRLGRVRGWLKHAEPVLVMTRTGFGHDQKRS